MNPESTTEKRTTEQFPDILSWVKRHQEMVCPKEEISGAGNIDKKAPALIERSKKVMWHDEIDKFFYFIDEEGNIMRFKNPDPEQITAIRDNDDYKRKTNKEEGLASMTYKLNDDDLAEFVINGLKTEGFKAVSRQHDIAWAGQFAINEYEKKQA